MRLSFIIVPTLLFSTLIVAAVAERTWHQKYRWQAEEYFEDPQVIALCRAIQANDIGEIDLLVASGAIVNAKGKGNMTPLLWAWPDGKTKRFRRLLEHGADPNVIFKSDFGSGKQLTLLGSSVTHLAAKSSSFEHFKAVFDHGGDPNLVQSSAVGRGDTPLGLLIKGGFRDKKLRIRILIDKKVDLNRLHSLGTTAPILAASWGGQYDIALMLLKAGASPKMYQSDEALKLTHVLAGEERRGRASMPELKADYQELTAWLEKHGESLEEARADIKRWGSWSTFREAGGKSEYRRKMDAEIAARKAREAREKQGHKPVTREAKE